MLYIDQPVQVGYSYDELINPTRDFATGQFSPTDFSDKVPEQNFTFYIGTTPSQKISHSANSSHQAAVALWHFAQIWFTEVSSCKLCYSIVK